jgi:hypothetical protein
MKILHLHLSDYALSGGTGVAAHVYKPQARQACRAELGLPSDKKLLMFAALGLKGQRKGGDLLVAALQGLIL